MPDPVALHPLDVDLLDFVDGSVDGAAAKRVEEHLSYCIICRIRVQRLRDVPPFELTQLGQVSLPSYATLSVEPGSGYEAQPGQLWVTDEDAAIVVLVRSVRADGAGVVVVPVVADVEVADIETLILGESDSPIGVPIAIYEQFKISVPTSALGGRVVPVRDVDLLKLTDATVGVTRGTPLEGPADPRLEVRQYLVDRLIALDEHEKAAASTQSYDAVLDDLREDLAMRRGEWCVVEPLDVLPTLVRREVHWRGVARIAEFGVRIVVVETPAGLNGPQDMVSAQALLARLDASAVVITTSLGESVELFDAPSLFGAFELPEGVRTTQPLIDGLSLGDTIAKFLDQKSRAALASTDTGAKARAVDVEEVLAQKVAKAIESKMRGASRLGEDKELGVMHLEGVAADLADALKLAFEPLFDVDDVARVVERDER